MKEYPFYNTVDTQIAFLDDEIISFREETYWMAGGVSTSYYYGATFSLETGELLTIDYFVTNFEELRSRIENFVYNDYFGV